MPPAPKTLRAQQQQQLPSNQQLAPASIPVVALGPLSDQCVRQLRDLVFYQSTRIKILETHREAQDAKIGKLRAEAALLKTRLAALQTEAKADQTAFHTHLEYVRATHNYVADFLNKQHARMGNAEGRLETLSGRLSAAEGALANRAEPSDSCGSEPGGKPGGKSGGKPDAGRKLPSCERRPDRSGHIHEPHRSEYGHNRPIGANLTATSRRWPSEYGSYRSGGEPARDFKKRRGEGRRSYGNSMTSRDP